MTQATIFAALRLPSGVLSSLESGNITAVHAQAFYKPNQDFALFADDSENNEVKISMWAYFERSQKFFEKNKCDILAARLQVPIESLQNALEQNGFIWLSYLRVYHLPEPVVIKNKANAVFLALENTIHINELQPVIDDITYEKRKREVENLEPPEPLDVQIQKMIEEVEIQHKMESLKKLDWIKEITTLGDRSIELEEKKNTYQAGTDFENIAKQGLEFLGFTIDESHKGGAGGLDLFCSKPYPLTGECKAGKSIPNHTVEELIRLGGTHLGVEGFISLSAKLVIGAGNPTNPMLDAAHQWKVSIIKAMTLQKLVELKAKYDGAIDLFELKKYLQSGQIDKKIDEYIQKVESEIKLRSQIVQIVKEEQYGDQYVSVTEIRSTYNAKYVTEPTQRLGDPVVKDLLIELSSPLAGYLGRVEENGKKCDRFYFLRDLIV
jgi:Domain of unknown function (DUF1802)